jgi:hypothetical protein
MQIEIFECLREFEFIFEKALAPKSGAHDGCFNVKNRVSKISWHCLFKNPTFLDIFATNIFI